MIPRNALLTATAIAAGILAGCSRDDPGNYREYGGDRTAKSRATPGIDRPPLKTAGNDAAAGTTPSGANPLRDMLPAAVGFGSRPIFSSTFRQTGEQILSPAIGPGATMAMVLRVSPPAKEDGTSQGAKTAGNKTGAARSRKPKVLITEKTFQKEGPEGAVRVTYDDIDLLKVLNMDPVTPDAKKLMPMWLLNLEGRKIRIRGFMSPAFKQTGLKSFLMGRDNKACCFPGRAKVYDLFQVKLRDGVTTNYIQGRPFDVVGTFYIKPWVEDGKVLDIYLIKDAVVVQ